MGLESATHVNQLVVTNPVGASDPKSQGDDHLRMIKDVLVRDFPNVGGIVGASHTELNILDGATLSTAELNILDGATLSTTELNLLDGVTIQLNTFSVNSYAPVLTAVANITGAITNIRNTYKRTANLVEVWGRVTIPTVDSNNETVFAVSLPIASNFSSADNAIGTAVIYQQLNATTAPPSGIVEADATNDRVLIKCKGSFSMVTPQPVVYSFQYEII